MKRRPLFFIVAACIVGAIIGLLLWPSKREPQYNGVSLSLWLVRYDSGIKAQDEAVDAIRHIGTNALPFLLRWIQHENGWKDSLGKKLLNWPVVGRNHLAHRLIWSMTSQRANSAVNGFRILGSQANPALLELQHLADNPKAPETAIRATQSLILLTQRFPGGVDVLR
jgi:hypothetical protein